MDNKAYRRYTEDSEGLKTKAKWNRKVHWESKRHPSRQGGCLEEGRCRGWLKRPVCRFTGERRHQGVEAAERRGRDVRTCARE